MSRSILAIFFLSLLCTSCHNNTQFLKITKELPNYPSASGIEFYKDQLYLIGDDAPQLLLLNKNLEISDSIALYPLTPKRI